MLYIFLQILRFPEYVKIGYANNLEKRMKDLNNSEAIPFAFRAYAVYEVTERLTDKKLHSIIDALNPDLRSVETFDGKERKREFYAMSAEEAYSLLECIATISGTKERLKRMKPTGHEVQDEKEALEIENDSKSRRSPLKFSMINLKPGDQILFKNDPERAATIVDDRHISYDGEVMSCTALARKFLGLDEHAIVPGTDYFTYDGVALPELRLRFEKE